MLSQDTLERYRRMSPGDRLALALRMTEENIPSLLEGPPATCAPAYWRPLHMGSGE